MAKFKYRMQNILDVKRKLEEQEKINYGIANAKLEDEKKKLRKLLLQRAGYEKELTGLVSGTIDLARIRMTKHAIDTMKTLIRSQMIQVHAAEANLEQARQRLKEVMIDRKTHEKQKKRQKSSVKTKKRNWQNSRNLRTIQKKAVAAVKWRWCLLH